MAPVPAKYPLGLEPCASCHRRARTDIRRACRLRRPNSAAASRAGAVLVPDACKFLYFRRRRPFDWPVRQLTLWFSAALQHAPVNNNENTSAKFSASGRAASQPAELPRENGAHRLVQCNTRGRRTSPATSAQQAGTRGRGTRAARQPLRAARGLIARHRERSEAIQGLPPPLLWTASSPCGRLAMTPLDLQPPSAGVGPCKFLFFHARRSRAQALRAPTAGSPRPPTALVNPCRSLLIAQIPGAAEPVRSGDRPVRRHGLSFPPPPPSAREESGERP
jgi:hypothetical protein